MDVNIREIFHNSGLHGKEFPQATFCIYKLKKGDETYVEIKRNIGKTNAEYMFIKDMTNYLDENKELPIKLYINYSLCSRCAKDLKKFASDHKINLTIYFAHLCCVNRRSCKDKEGCKCDTNGNKANEEGLRELNGSVKIRTSNENDWNVLNLFKEKVEADLKVLENLARDESTRRKEEDINEAADLQAILEARK